MTTYRGHRVGGEWAVIRGYWGSLPLRRDLMTCSDGGFQWGSHVGGCKQLALALLADAAGDSVALRHYVEFLHEWVCELDPAIGWTITSEAILAWVAEQEFDDE